MHLDFMNKALETAKQLQQTVADAVTKGSEQAQPLIADAVTRAQALQKSLVEQAPGFGEAAQKQLDAAHSHLNTFIAAGTEALGKGSEASQAGLAALAENARQAIHITAKAVSEATAPKPPAPPTGG
jgi:hypothetical protein